VQCKLFSNATFTKSLSLVFTDCRREAIYKHQFSFPTLLNLVAEMDPKIRLICKARAQK
jgi:hypothetical protein